jgi:hypothetical protein
MRWGKSGWGEAWIFKIKIKIKIKIKGVGLTASGFAFGELLDKAPSNQGLELLV